MLKLFARSSFLYPSGRSRLVIEQDGRRYGPSTLTVGETMKVYGTPKAAKLVGVHYLTLHRWIGEKKIKPNGITLADGRTLYQWTEKDIETAKKIKAETKLGRPPKGTSK